MGINRCRVVAACVLLCGCRPPEPRSPAQAPASAEFVGRAWLSTDEAAPRGTLRVFLANGTLLMDSCVETYRLARWQAIDERRIEWQEDTARIEAEIIELTGERLRLRLRLVGGPKDETYRLARAPLVCPDMPR